MTTNTTHRGHTRRIHEAAESMMQAEVLWGALYDASKAHPNNYYVKVALEKAQALVNELEANMTHLMDLAVADGMDPEDFS